MENITHTTARGSSEFGLTNTNKLIRQYEYATGLKTGSTGKAKFCVSATASKNGVDLIAVIMGAEDSKSRFKDAVTLLNYGFGKCQIYNSWPDLLSDKRERNRIRKSDRFNTCGKGRFWRLSKKDLEEIIITLVGNMENVL